MGNYPWCRRGYAGRGLCVFARLCADEGGRVYLRARESGVKPPHSRGSDCGDVGKDVMYEG